MHQRSTSILKMMASGDLDVTDLVSEVALEEGELWFKNSTTERDLLKVILTREAE